MKGKVVVTSARPKLGRCNGFNDLRKTNGIETEMQQTPTPVNDDSLSLLDQKRALEDEIWFLAVAENFAKRKLKMGTREQILERYYAEYPDLRKYVEDHVARKTCLFAIRELRERRDKRRQAAEVRRLASLPKPTRNPEMAWMAPFLAEPMIVAPLARPLPSPPFWGISSDELDRALEALPEETTQQASVAPLVKDAFIYRTGLPGKPSSWWLVEEEVRRRFTPDQAPMKTAEWARAMREWLRREHPNAPPVTEKTLTNKLAGLLRRLKATAESAR